MKTVRCGSRYLSCRHSDQDHVCLPVPWSPTISLTSPTLTTLCLLPQSSKNQLCGPPFSVLQIINRELFEEELLVVALVLSECGAWLHLGLYLCPSLTAIWPLSGDGGGHLRELSTPISRPLLDSFFATSITLYEQREKSQRGQFCTVLQRDSAK